MSAANDFAWIELLGAYNNGAMAMNLDECEREGEEAGRSAIPASDCPYMYVKAGVDQKTFDALWRPKLDAWFAGWKRTAPPPRKNPRRGGVRK